jgi:hypothetical protein
LQCLGAIRGKLDVVAVRPQRPAERFANRIVVVDDEDVHAWSIGEQVKALLKVCAGFKRR